MLAFPWWTSATAAAEEPADRDMAVAIGVGGVVATGSDDTAPDIHAIGFAVDVTAVQQLSGPWAVAVDGWFSLGAADECPADGSCAADAVRRQAVLSTGLQLDASDHVFAQVLVGISPFAAVTGGVGAHWTATTGVRFRGELRASRATDSGVDVTNVGLLVGVEL